MLTPLSINSLSQGPRWQKPPQVSQINRPDDVQPLAGRSFEFSRLSQLLRVVFSILKSTKVRGDTP